MLRNTKFVLLVLLPSLLLIFGAILFFPAQSIERATLGATQPIRTISFRLYATETDYFRVSIHPNEESMYQAYKRFTNATGTLTFIATAVINASSSELGRIYLAWPYLNEGTVSYITSYAVTKYAVSQGWQPTEETIHNVALMQSYVFQDWRNNIVNYPNLNFNLVGATKLIP